MNDKTRGFRPFIVLLTIVAWLSISNHCAVAAMVAAKMQSPTAQMHCHGSQPSPSKKSGDEQTPCCKVLRATLVQLANSVPAFDFSAFSIQPYFGGLNVFSEQSHAPQTFELDTGPPFRGSFAELVLQRSVLAHAPPISLS